MVKREGSKDPSLPFCPVRECAQIHLADKVGNLTTENRLSILATTGLSAYQLGL